MTEAQWLACDDPWNMWRFLRGRLSKRKNLLLACAGFRRLWHVLADPRVRRLVEVQEHNADCAARIDEVVRAGRDATEAMRVAASKFPPRPTGSRKCRANRAARAARARANAEVLAAETASLYLPDNGWWALVRLAIVAKRDARSRGEPGIPAIQKERRQHCHLIRDLFGNPFRPVTVDPGWRSPTVMAVAGALYEERRLQDLPVLADALEEAGCADPDILRHCRGPGPHALGCWVVDLLLEKR